MSCEFCGDETHAAQGCTSADGQRYRAALMRQSKRSRWPRFLYGSDDETTGRAAILLALRYAIALVALAIGMWFGTEWLMRHGPTQ